MHISINTSKTTERTSFALRAGPNVSAVTEHFRKWDAGLDLSGRPIFVLRGNKNGDIKKGRSTKNMELTLLVYNNKCPLLTKVERGK